MSKNSDFKIGHLQCGKVFLPHELLPLNGR